jgi:hypothetical protein
MDSVKKLAQTESGWRVYDEVRMGKLMWLSGRPGFFKVHKPNLIMADVIIGSGATSTTTTGVGDHG